MKKQELQQVKAKKSLGELGPSAMTQAVTESWYVETYHGNGYVLEKDSDLMIVGLDSDVRFSITPNEIYRLEWKMVDVPDEKPKANQAKKA